MAGTNACLGKALICPAHKIQCNFTTGIGPIDYRPRIAALMAKHQTFQQKIIGTASGMFSAIHQHTHFAEAFSIDQRLMGIFYHYPILSFLMQALLGLIADLHLSPLHHIADIGFILQHL